MQSLLAQGTVQGDSSAAGHCTGQLQPAATLQPAHLFSPVTCDALFWKTLPRRYRYCL